MPITGKFEADFTSFSRAVQDADVQLRSFEDDSKRVASSLARMTDQFSGRRIIQDATLMAESIERIGGVSKLTEAELQRLGTTAQEAVAKMRALGMDVPTNLQRIADATKNASTATASWGVSLGTVSSVLAGFGIAASVQGVMQFGRTVLDAGDAIQKMADQTSLSITEVQKLQYVAGQSGTSVESMISAVQNLQVRIGGGDAGLAGAAKQLSLSLTDIASKSAYDQMVTFTEAIRAVKDPTEQASIAAEVFGRNWKELLPAIKAGMREVGDEAPLMAEDVVRALDMIGDAWTRAKANAIVFAGTVVGAMTSAADAVARFAEAADKKIPLLAALDEVGTKTDSVAGMLAKLPPLAGFAGQAFDGLTLSADALAEAEKRITKEVEDQITATKTAAEQQKSADTIGNRLLGLDKLTEAMNLLEAIERRHIDVSNLNAEAQKFVAETAEAGIKALIETGDVTDPLIAKLAEMEAKALAAGQALRELAASEKAATDETKRLNDEMDRAFKASGGGMSADAAASFARQQRGEIGPIVGSGSSPMRPSVSLAPSAFAERGINAPSIAAPVTGGGGTIVNNFEVNGTGQDVARVALAEISRQLSVGTQWALTQNA